MGVDRGRQAMRGEEPTGNGARTSGSTGISPLSSAAASTNRCSRRAKRAICQTASPPVVTARIAKIAAATSHPAIRLAIVAVTTGGLAVWQIALFARRLHRFVEAAADESGLIPVDPLVRAPLPVGSSPRIA